MPQGAWADYANTTRAGGYAVANLGATATLNERASVFLDARNLFDRRGVADISAATLVTPASAVYSPLDGRAVYAGRSEEHTSELQSLMRNSYAVFCLQKKTQ